MGGIPVVEDYVGWERNTSMEGYVGDSRYRSRKPCIASTRMTKQDPDETTYARSKDQVGHHMKTIAVATCFNYGCPNRAIRSPVEGNPTMCPSCGFALMYYRVKKSVPSSSKEGHG